MTAFHTSFLFAHIKGVSVTLLWNEFRIPENRQNWWEVSLKKMIEWVGQPWEWPSWNETKQNLWEKWSLGWITLLSLRPTETLLVHFCNLDVPLFPFQDSRVAVKACEGLILCSSLPDPVAAHCMVNSTRFCQDLTQRLIETYKRLPAETNPADLENVQAKWG